MTPEKTNAAIESVRRVYEHCVRRRSKPPTAAKMARELLKIGDNFLLDNMAVGGTKEEIEHFTKLILDCEPKRTVLLCNLASRLISDGRRLPPTLAGHVQMVLKKEAERLVKSVKGRPPGDSIDPRIAHCIVESVEILRDVFPGLKATRQRESQLRPGAKRVESACSLVKKGLEKAGHRMSERAISNVWETYRSLKKHSD